MDILNEFLDHFALTLDKALLTNPAHHQASAKLNTFCKQLPEEQASELNDIVGKLSSAIFESSAKAGMKLGAKIAVALLRE